MANEKRLIDANALLEKMQFRREVTDAYLQAIRDCVIIGRSLVMRAPTVDAVEVVHGRWLLPKEYYGLVCSVCGGSCWYYDYEQTIGESNYCPNCGAKMDCERREGELVCE